MSKVIEMQRLGQALPFDLSSLVRKVRVEFDYIPGITIDLSQKTEKAGFISSTLKPRATVLVGDNAYQINPFERGRIKKVNASVFDTPTIIDQLMNIGAFPIIASVIGIGAITYYLIRRK